MFSRENLGKWSDGVLLHILADLGKLICLCHGRASVGTPVAGDMTGCIFVLLYLIVASPRLHPR